MSTRVLSSLALISTFITPSAVGQISFYNVATGAFSTSNNPALSGGPYAGFTIAQVFATAGIKVNVRGASTTELVITDNSGSHYYNVATGAFFSSNNATLSGGPYTGQTKGQVFASGVLINDRNVAGSQLVITNANGNHYYNATTGAFNSSANPTLTGGPYAGKTIGQLFIEGVTIRVRGGAQPNLVIANGSGNHFYNDSTGAFSITRNPTLTGGPFAGQTIGQAFIAGAFVDNRETAGSELSLTPRTLPASTTSLAASPASTAVLGSPVTLTATVAPSIATGKVMFLDGAQILGYASLASGQATFTTRLLASGVRRLRAMYTGNGNVAVSTSSPVSYTITSIAGAGFQSLKTYPASNALYAMAIADIDLDGDADLIVTNNLATGTIQVLRNNGNGTFASAISTTVHASPVSLATGDFNEDGVPDVAIGLASDEVGILLGNGNGTFQTPTYLALDATGYDIHSADFNGDGHADIGAIATSGTVGVNEYDVFLGNGNGTFQARKDIALGGAFWRYGAVGYFNSDNIVDVVVADNSDNNLRVLLGNGNGTFTQATGSPLATGATPREIAVNDLDGDGNADLAIAFHGANQVGVYLGSATGQFFSSGTIPVGATPNSLVSTDFNGDGRTDLVTSSYVNTNLSPLIGMPGSPYFSAQPVINVSPMSPVAVRVADLNGDGRADVAFSDIRNPSSGVGVLIAYGPPASITSVAGTPQSAPIGGPFGIRFQAVVRDSSGTPVPGASVNFVAPASGASGAFSTSATVTTDANGIAVAPQFIANSTAGTYVVDAFVTGVATPASFTLTNTGSAISGLDYYNSTGAFEFTLNPTLSSGPYAGQTVTQVFSSGARVDLRDSTGSELAIFNANGVHYYNIGSGAFVTSYNPTLTGGPYNGQTLGQAFSSGAVMYNRDTSGTNLVIFSATGAHFYNIVTGAFAASHNPTLTAGPLAGQSIGQLFSSGTQMAMRDSAGSELLIFNGSGAHYYNTANGTFIVSVNPTLTGGPNYNLKLGDAYTAGIIVRGTDVANKSYLILLSAPVVGAPATITPLAGSTPQATMVNTAFPTPLKAVVRDSFSHPVPGASVTFAAPGSGASGTFSGSVTVTTDANGIATAPAFTANSTIGSYIVTPTVSGVGSPANFQLTNAVGSSEGLDFYNVTTGAFAFTRNPTLSGGPYNGQMVAQLFSIAGIKINVRGLAGAELSIINTNGVHVYNVTTGAFAQSYNAALSGGGPYSGMTIGQVFALGRQINVRNSSGFELQILDTNGSHFYGFSGPFQSSYTSTLSGGPYTGNTIGQLVAMGLTLRDRAVLGSQLSITDANGSHFYSEAGPFANSNNPTLSGGRSSGLTVGQAFLRGSYVDNRDTVGSTLVLLRGGFGAPASITATAGTPQSVQIGSAFPTALKVQVQDAVGNLLENVSVTFTAPSSGVSGTFASSAVVVTDASGIATAPAFTANNTAGTYSVTANVTSAPLGSPASFSLTNTPGPPAAVAATGGTPQTTPVNSAFPAALQAAVTDAFGNAVQGVTVTFASPSTSASAMLSSTMAVTNAAGVASITATANTVTGTYNVTATASGVGTSASFSLTNTAGAPASIIAASGTPQSTSINAAFGNPLVVIVRDAFNNLVPGASVTFTAPGSGASAVLSSGTAITSASGQASITASANNVIGSYSVTATVSGVGTSAIFNLTNTAGAPASIVVTSGTPQTAPISTAFTNPLVVTVRDASSNPVPGATITFTAPASGASAVLSSSTAVTNASGQASITATANTTAGAYIVAASLGGVGTTADFGLTNTAGPAASIVASGGTSQTAQINTPFATPLQVTVKDSGGNPVSGVTVNFTAPGSGASAGLSSPTAVTNASGQASVTATANSTAGAYTVSASVAGVATPATFTLTNTVGPPGSIQINAGDAQSATIVTAFTTTLEVVVRDNGANPVPGVTVTFSVPASGASATLSSMTAVTNASGIASVTATANGTAGSYSVGAVASGVATPVAFSLTNTVGAPASLAVVSGTPQSAQITTAFASPLVVVVKDAGGNPVSGATVTFAVPGSGASAALSSMMVATNASGQASVSATANNTTGAYSITASVSGVGTPASFSLTNLNGPPDNVSVVSGSPQSRPINTAFTNPLVVLVRDIGGNPVPSVTVTFTVPTTGASAVLSSMSAVTNASGQASVSATANSAAGSYSVAVTASGVAAPATFNLTNVPGAPASIAIAGGNSQSAEVNTAFVGPLIAVVKDTGGNPVPGATVTFAAPGSGATASLSLSSVTTDANGQASITAIASSAAGTYNVTVLVSGVGAPAAFELTNTPGPPGSIAAVSGTPQSTSINAAFGNPLVVIVRDSSGNPVGAGTMVTFTVPSSGPSASVSSVTVSTDPSGQASVTATANSTAGTYNITAAAAGVAAPATFSMTNTPGAAAAITVTAGGSQSTDVNTGFVSPLIATVRDSGNNPVPGATVTFTVPASGPSAAVSLSLAMTDSSGQVSVTAAANGTTGTYNVTASVSGVGTPAQFQLSNTSGPPGSITATSGTPQSTQISTAFSNPLVVTVLDSGGNAVSGATVTFTVPGSGASAVLSSGTAITNGSGQASVTVTANTTAGSYTVTASVAGVAAAATFSLTNTPGIAASITTTSGTPQSAQINMAFANPLVVTVKDVGNNPVPGVTVTFTVPGSGASATLSLLMATTDANGVASVTATANSLAGSYTATASVAGVGTPATFNLTNTVGTPGSITATSGTPQSTPIGTPFGSALVVTVRDAGGNPVSGVTVMLAVPASGASAVLSATTAVTNASGQASVTATANNTAGSYTVTASASGVASPASFSLTNTVGAPASITAASGTPQSTTISTAFPSALVVTILDAGGNPVAGATVAFAGPGSGPSAALSSSTAVTNASGRASTTATANSTTGSYAVTASVAGVAAPASFGLTNTAGAAGSIATVSGTPQSTGIGSAFSAPLRVVVRDAGNNPVSGVTVTFAAPGSGASATLSSATAVTDASGQASITAIANTIAGSYTVTATAAGVATSANFALTNSPGSPSSIAGDGGASQNAPVNMAFSSPLLVTVRDSGGNPLSGVTVTFAAPGSGASAMLSWATATTNASGQASVTATANAIAGSYSVTASVSGIAGGVSFTLTNTAGAAAQIAIGGGNSQSAQVNTTFGGALQVVVKDAAGNPVPNVTVTLAAPGSGASANLSSVTVTTNASGVSAVNATANSTSGSYSVTAALPSGISVPFALTNTAGAPSQLTILGGSSQSAQIYAAFSQALQVELRDASGNPVPGVTVTFAPPATGASAALSAATALTNAQGRASVTATANSTAGTYDVAASISGAAAPVTFHLTNTPGAPAAIEPSDGSGACGSGGSSPSSDQSTQIFSPFPLLLGVKVVDSGCNPVAGVSVTFTVPGLGASALLSAITVTTGANGIASVTATANNIAGTYFVPASVSGVTNAATFRLTNTTGSAANILVTGGTPQSTRINTAFPTLLQIAVRDAGGNPVPGATVTFSAPGSGPSALLSAITTVTDAQGRVSVTASANSVAGSYDVFASVVGGSTPAAFHLTNAPGTPAEISTEDGGASGGCSGSGPINSSQSTEVLTGFALPLSVTVRDAGCNPVPGASVTFAVPASGPSASLSAVTAITNAQGVASVNAVANVAVGSYPVTASVTSVSAPAIFNLTNIAGPPGSIAPADGSASTPQSTQIETSFAKPLTVTVKDAQGNPVSSATVTFSIPASGASAVLSSAAAVTDAQGNASVTATANSIAGSYVVTAYVAGVAAPASFQLTNLPGAPAGIASDVASACAGLGSSFSSAQSAKVNTLFSLPLQVAVFDAKCNPVPGVTVTFAAPGSGVSAILSATSAVTDADGVARVYAKANATAGSYQPSATVADVSPAVFNLTNTPGTPGTILIKSGSPQTTLVTAAFANALVAIVKDSGGNPLSGVVVTFTAPGSAIQLSSTTAATNAQGEVSITVTAGAIAGSYFVSAGAAGASTSAFFYLTATAGTAARIVPGGGSGTGGVTEIAAQPNAPFSSPLSVTVLDANGNPVSGVPVTFTLSGACTSLSATSVTTDAHGRVVVTGTAAGTPGVCEITASVAGGAEPIRFRVTITSQVTLHAVTDAASFQRGAAPGALMTIFGVNLANPASLPDGKQIIADKYPLSTTLGGVTLTVNGIPAPLLYVSPNQINFQLPQELEVELKEVDGVKQMLVKVVVTHDGTNSGEMTMRITESAPAIFTIAPDFRRAAAENLDLSVNTAENPVAPGSYILMFATGQGTTEPHVPTGQPAPADKLAWSVQPISATIAGRSVTVQYGGLAPGFAGLLQVNLHVPDDLPPGEQPVVITINGVASKPANIFVGRR